MAAPIAWAALAIGGFAVAGWAARETGEALESGQRFARWAVAGGVVYVSYRALQSAGALK